MVRTVVATVPGSFWGEFCVAPGMFQANALKRNGSKERFERLLPPEALPTLHLAHEALLHLAASATHRLEHLAHLSVLAEEVVDL